METVITFPKISQVNFSIELNNGKHGRIEHYWTPYINLEEWKISVDATIYSHDRQFSFLLALMSEALPAIQRLLRRLITSLPPEPSPWEGPNRPHNDLLDFEDFEGGELNLLATFLRSNPVSPEETLAANDDTNLFTSFSSFDDEWDADDRRAYPTLKVTAYPLKALVDTFNIQDASEDARVLFTELYRNDQFRSAESFRDQVFLAVEYMHSEGYRRPYR
jgi:hypothetical protein